MTPGEMIMLRVGGRGEVDLALRARRGCARAIFTLTSWQMSRVRGPLH